MNNSPFIYYKGVKNGKSKNNGMFEIEWTWWEKLLKIIGWYKLCTFFENWIYPGSYMMNLLFHNYNKIQLPMFKPYEYLDVSDRMKFAIFELIKTYIEKEEPEKYICWYKDPKTGEDIGHKYGENDQKIMFDSQKGKYVMDLIKEIYNFYTKVLPELEYEKNYFLMLWSKYILNGHWKDDSKIEDIVTWINEDSNYTLEDLEKDNLDWNIILKYIEKKERFFEKDLIYNEYNKLRGLIEDQTQYYLHLAVELRYYLWS